jgi:transposase
MGFVQGVDRHQMTLMPECLEDFIDADNPVRAIEVFVDKLDLRDLEFMDVVPAEPNII